MKLKFNKMDKVFEDHETGARYRRVVAGIGWPYLDKPGLLVVVGEDAERDHSIMQNPRHMRIFAEHESDELPELHQAGVKFKDNFGFNHLIGDTEDVMSQSWRQTFGSILQVHSPANEDLLNLRFVAQSVKKYSEHNKILHFGESVVSGKIQNLTADDVETKSIDRFPGLSALGCVLLEMEFGRPESESLGGFVPKRSTNTRWFR